MHLIRLAFVLAALAGALMAQDRVTLKNGDVLTGSIKTMVDGKLTLVSPSLGEVVVPFADIENLATSEPVRLQTTEGDLLRRRIAGIEAGKIKFGAAGEGAPTMPEMAVSLLDQINPPEEPPIEWTGSVTIGANLVTGNTERRSIGAAFEAARRTELDRITADASFDYSEDKRVDDPTTPGVDEGGWDITQRRAGAGLKYDYFLSKKLYSLVTARVLGDTPADIDLRFTAGAGIGYQWIEEEDVQFSTEVGLSYFSEEYRSGAPETEYVAARVAYKYMRNLSEATRIVHSVEAYPSLEDADDVYFQMSTALQNKLFGDMIAQLGWVWDYDNTPAPGRERNDHRVTLSIGWTF